MKCNLFSRSPLLIVTMVVLPFAIAPLSAQHDPQRNATQEIARGDFAKAEKELAKADDKDPETRFVRMMLELKKGDIAAAQKHAGAALDAGLPLSRLLGGPAELLDGLRRTEVFQQWYEDRNGSDIVLLHGPMVGRVSDTRAAFWLRTPREARVQVRIGERVSAEVASDADTGFVAICEVDGLHAATSYQYEVLIDGEVVTADEAEHFSFSTFPAAGDGGKFRVAFGGGAGYVPSWEYMWDTIRGFEPQVLLMLGDNVYIDQPQLMLAHDYCYQRRQDRAEWRRLTASTAVYSIYDDHDFGTNDCIPGPEIDQPKWKRKVWNKFRENWINPAYGGGPEQPGCWYDFAIGDVHFLMLDGRYYRDRDGGSMLGPVQKAWLKQTLKNSDATFKILASPVPWTPGIKPGSRDPWDGFPEEREEIFRFIEEQKIDGVFLVAADRHRTDLRVIERAGGYDLYEFESSRLTNRHTHKVIQTPGLIWGYNETCSFGLMHFDTTADDPQVRFECIDIDGEVRHQYLLRHSALQHGE